MESKPIVLKQLDASVDALRQALRRPGPLWHTPFAASGIKFGRPARGGR